MLCNHHLILLSKGRRFFYKLDGVLIVNWFLFINLLRLRAITLHVGLASNQLSSRLIVWCWSGPGFDLEDSTIKIIIKIAIRTLVNHLSWLKVWLEDSLPTGWIILINKIMILIPIIHPYLYLTNCSKYLPGFLIGILLSFGIFCFFLCFAGCFCEETFHNMNSLCEV